MKYEVTTSQYDACKLQGVCGSPSVADWDGEGWGLNGSDRPTHPQNGITWQQARDFCVWTVQQTGGSDGRLPSEAQWEYAAAGPVHRKYPWGDGPEADCDQAVYDPDGSYPRPWGCDPCTTTGCSGTQPVGSKPAGASYVGAMDMAGNLIEWCEDWYHDRYAGAPEDGSAWEDPSGPGRILRGGSFVTFATSLRSAGGRGNDIPTTHNAHYGARCVRGL